MLLTLIPIPNRGLQPKRRSQKISMKQMLGELINRLSKRVQQHKLISQNLGVMAYLEIKKVCWRKKRSEALSISRLRSLIPISHFPSYFHIFLSLPSQFSLQNQFFQRKSLHYLPTTHQTMTASCFENSVDSKFSLVGLAPLEAVLFDIDGTLCDSDPIHLHAFREMLQEIGFNGGVPITEEFFIENIAGKHNDDIAALLFPDDIQRGLKIVDDKETMFRRLVKEHLRPIDGLYKLKKWIEDRGLKRAAVTNASRESAELMLSILGLSDFFQVVIVGSECEHAKPHPDPYLKALQMLNVSKQHTFIFEDSFSGIKAGVAAGMPVVGLKTRNPENLLKEAKPIFLIKDYADPKLWAALEELDKKEGRATN